MNYPYQDDRKKFYCREWVFQKLLHCLDQRPISKTCGALLLGNSGCGKTTLCQEICIPTQYNPQTNRQQRLLNRRLLCYYFLHGHNERTLSLNEFIRTIVTQILNHSTESHKERQLRRRLLQQQQQLNEGCSEEIELETKNSPTIPENNVNLPVNPRTLIADAYLEKLKSDPEIQIALRAKNIELNPDDCLKRALLFPLLEIDPPKTALFILIDSIDEYSFIYTNSTLTRSKPKDRCYNGGNNGNQQQQSRTIAELLANHHHLFPQWLLLVCTARKQSKSIAKMFTGFRKLSLDDLRKNHVVRDVQQYILARLDQENSLRQHISRDTAEMLNQLHIKSNGCFLYLEKVLDGISDNFIILREIKEIPGTLNGLYLWLCQRLFQKKQFQKVQPLLNIILAIKCNLNELLLFDIIKVIQPKLNLEEFKKRFNLLRRLLIINKSGNIRLFHHSFAEWLLDIKHCTQKYLCNINIGHCILSMYYTIHAKFLNNQEIYDYVYHLTRMEQYLLEKPLEKSLIIKKFQLQQLKQQQLKQQEEENLLLDLEQSLIETETSIDEIIGDKFETITLQQQEGASALLSTTSVPIYAEIKKVSSSKKQQLQLQQCEEKQQEQLDEKLLDTHTLIVLWLILSGCNVEDCLLDGNEISGVNFGAYLPTDQKVMKLLLEAGAVEQIDNDGCEYESQMSLISSSTEPSPEPLFDLHDLHGQAALHVAARLGQAQVVKVLLEAGANADQADVDGWTPLRAAAWGGHTEVVELLVNHGCLLDSVDSENRTALRAAAWSGHEEIVRILLKNGANVNLTDHEGRTALIAASYMGHSEIVEHLLDYGADINHSDTDGRTALSVAALCAPRQPSVNVVSTLLERGASVDHKDKEGMTPLLVASFEGHKDICELLLENEADVDHCDNSGRSPLWAAASMGHAPVVALLLFWGCCIDSMDSEGRTVLSVASAQGCVDVVRQLLDRGLDEQHRDNSGWTPLHYASFEGHLDVCEALLESGARIDETDNEGKSPLILAAQCGHTALVQLFLEKYNAPVDQRPHDGKTALRLAALEGHYEIVQLLLQFNADINSKDSDGRSTLYVLALDNRLAMSKYFIQHGADVETRDLEGRTPLHVSSWQGHTEMVQLLIKYGKCQIDACDLENRTALHSASWQGHNDIVKILLENSAKPDHTCNQGATALGIAAQEGHELCVVALLEYGADPNHSDSCGRNALRVAAKSGHRGVVRLLEEFNATRNRVQQQQQQPQTSSSANSITSASTAETKPSCAVLYPNEWSEQQQQQQRRSMVSLGNHSSNSKSSSNLTGSSHSSRHGNNEQRNIKDSPPQLTTFITLTTATTTTTTTATTTQLSFTQQLQQCGRGGKTRPLSKLLSPLQSEPQSPIYASPPLSPIHDSSNIFGFSGGPIYQPVLRHNFAKPPDTHFARDTHMRIILGNSSISSGNNSGSSSGGGGGFLNRFEKRLDFCGSSQQQHHPHQQETKSSQKPKRNGIVTNPALRLVANVKNGLDTAAANLRKSTSNSNPSMKTNSFHWRKETPL